MRDAHHAVHWPDQTWVEPTDDTLFDPVDPASWPPRVREAFVARGVVQLLLYSSDWVLRRVESFRFVDEHTVRRQMSIDFCLPRRSTSEMGMDLAAVDTMLRLGSAAVPITTLRKEKLTDLDLWDEDGRTLPMTTTSENGEVASHALASLAWLVANSFGEDWTPMPEQATRALDGVATLPAREANLLLDCMIDGVDRHVPRLALYEPPSNGPDRRSNEARALHELVAGVRAIEAAHLGHRLRAVLGDASLQSLARQLATDFIVLMDLGNAAHERRIVKLAYEEQVALPSERRQQQSRSRRARRRIAERCCWLPKAYNLDTFAVGTAESHHVEFEAPQHTDVVDAFMRAAYYETQGTRRVQRSATSRHDHRNNRHAHLHLRKLPAEAQADAFVSFRASPGGVLYQACLLAWCIFALLLLGRGELHGLQTDAAAALLLAVPTALAAYIARPSEHPVASQALSGVRVLVGLSGLFLFIGAWRVVFGGETGTVQSRWADLRWPAGVIALLLSMSVAKAIWPVFPRTRRAAQLANRRIVNDS
jgi:hypothetical protein